MNSAVLLGQPLLLFWEGAKLRWLLSQVIINQDGYGTVEVLIIVAAVTTIAGSVAAIIKGLLVLINHTASGKITDLQGSGY